MFKIDFTIKFLTRISDVAYKYNKIEGINFDATFMDVFVYKYLKMPSSFFEATFL